MIFYCGFKQYIFNAENQVEKIMQKLICKGGTRSSFKGFVMLVVMMLMMASSTSVRDNELYLKAL